MALINRQSYKDSAKNAFQKSNLFYAGGPFLGIQDPTVFGFKLLFHFDNVDSPLLYGLNSDISKAPANTAAGFLKSIKDEQRLYYLEKFIYLLSGINKQCPWYFQTLGGLKEAWMHDYNIPLIKDKKLTVECAESIDLRVTAMLDLYRKACYDWKYRREVVPKNLRQFKMSVYVYEARWINNPNSIALGGDAPPVEYGYGGNIQGEQAKVNAELVSRLTGKDETIGDPKTADVNITEGTPMSTTRNLFHFDWCEFGGEPGHLDTISNMEPADVKQKFEISYKDVEEENMYNFWTGTDPITDSFVRTLDRAALDDPEAAAGELTPAELRPTVSDRFPSLKDRAKKIGADIADLQNVANDKWAEIKARFDPKAVGNRLLDQATARAENAIGAAVNKFLLGNVYGLSPLTLTGEAGLQQLSGAILDAGASLVNGGDGIAGGNPLQQSNSLANDGGTPPSGTPGDVSDNVYGNDPGFTPEDQPNYEGRRSGQYNGYKGEKDTDAF